MQTHIYKTPGQSLMTAPRIMKEPSTGGTAIITDNRLGTIYQRKLREAMNAHTVQKANPIQRKTNNTGLPDNLKTGMENLSGYAMDDVKVHYNSSKPAQLNAHAYARGTDIYLGPGQEKHLPHELGHVVQQKKGVVKPTTLLQGNVKVNDDAGLEKEADVMGKSASHTAQTSTVDHGAYKPGYQGSQVIQRAVGFEFEIRPNVKTYKSGLDGTYAFLNKKDRIVEGTDFYVEADEIVRGETSWEFVTVPFPESKQGLIRLIKACGHMENIADRLRQSPSKSYNPVDNDLLTSHGKPVPDRYFYKTTAEGEVLIVKPQVTAGFSLSALDRLYHSISTPPGTAGTSNLIRDVNDYRTYKKNTETREVDESLGEMRASADNAIVSMGLNTTPGVDKLRALVTYLVQVIIGGKRPIQASPKTVMRLALARTDMAAVYGSLPLLIRNQFTANPQQFVNLVMTAASDYQGSGLWMNRPVMSGRLFTLDMFQDDPESNMRSPFKRVSRKQWLLGLVNGRDLLSAGHYPERTNRRGEVNETDRKANVLLDSMGGLHNKLDPGNRPIFEIRNSNEIYTGLITPFALDFFNYVRFLNAPLQGQESDYLTGLSNNEAMWLAVFDEKRPQIRKQMELNALNNY